MSNKDDDSLLENEDLISSGQSKSRPSDDPEMSDILADIDTSEIDVYKEDDISDDELMKEFDDLLGGDDSEEDQAIETSDHEEIDRDDRDPDAFDFELHEKNQEYSAEDFAGELELEEEDAEEVNADSGGGSQDGFDESPTIVEQVTDIVKKNLLNVGLGSFAIFFLTSLFWPQGDDSYKYSNDSDVEFVADMDWEDQNYTVENEPLIIKKSQVDLAEKPPQDVQDTAINPIGASPEPEHEVVSIPAAKVRMEAPQEVFSIEAKTTASVSVESGKELVVSEQMPTIQSEAITINSTLPELDVGQLPRLDFNEQQGVISSNNTEYGYPTTTEQLESVVADPEMVVKNKEAVYLILEKMKEKDLSDAAMRENDRLQRGEILSALRSIKTTVELLRKDVDAHGKEISSVKRNLTKLKDQQKKKTIAATRSVSRAKEKAASNKTTSKIAYQVISTRPGVGYVVSNRTGKLVRLEEGSRLIGYGKILKILPGFIIKTENGLVKTKPRV